MSSNPEGEWVYIAGSWRNLAERRPLARAGPAPSGDDDVTVIEESGTVDVADWR